MSATFRGKLTRFWSENRTSLNAIAGVVAGLLVGLIVKAIFWPGNAEVDPNLLRYLSLPSLLFIRAFLILIIPLLIASLSTSFFSDRSTVKSSENDETAEEAIDPKMLLMWTFAFFIAFSTIVVFLGISLMAFFQPGANFKAEDSLTLPISSKLPSEVEKLRSQLEKSTERTDMVYNIILNIVPDNIASILFMTSITQTEVVWPSSAEGDHQNEKNSTISKLISRSTPSFKANFLGLCSLSLALGMLLQHLGPTRTAAVRQLLTETLTIVNSSMEFLLKLMPAGMFCWMFTEALKMKSIGAVAVQLVLFYAILLTSFALVLLLFYPLVFFLFTRTNGFRLYRALLPAILVGAGSCSSAITLPFTMQCMQTREGRLAKGIANSVLPLGMTLHMNGTCMYYPMVALFVAQMKGVQVDLFTLVMLGLFSVVMSMGMPAAPSGGSVIVNHITYAAVLGIDNATDVLAYVMAFEFIMERIRTPTNVIGDCFAARCIQALVLPKYDHLAKMATVEENGNCSKLAVLINDAAEKIKSTEC